MADLKKIGMAAGTFSVALGIGFVMQNGDALANRFGDDNVNEPTPFTQAEAPVEIVQASLTGEVERAPKDVVVPIEPELPADLTALDPPTPKAEFSVAVPETPQTQERDEVPVELASINPELLADIESPVGLTSDIMTDAAVSEVGEIDCVPTMKAVAGSAATIELAVSAPCHTDTVFTVHHQGMMFSAKTGAEGNSEFVVPALSEVAVVIAAFEHGDGAVETVTIPDFSNYDRAVLQWRGETAVMLSAYENGAAFATENHISPENPGDIARVEAGIGGYLMQLGVADVENALMAEVYTYPSGMMTAGGSVVLVAEAEITPANCGNDLTAQSIQVAPTGDAMALDLNLVMPDCEAVGDFLVLQNMFQDLTLASR